MRFGIMVMAALGMAPIVLTQTSANALPYDPSGINAWRP
jgi:hypothetical protein